MAVGSPVFAGAGQTSSLSVSLSEISPRAWTASAGLTGSKPSDQSSPDPRTGDLSRGKAVMLDGYIGIIQYRSELTGDTQVRLLIPGPAASPSVV